MPLFGMTLSLGELRDKWAATLACELEVAEAIISRKLRRGEIIAFCEWAYAAGGGGEVLTSHKLSPEPWILTRHVDWEASSLRVSSPAAREVSSATDIYIRTSDLDFLNEQHSPEEVARETPRRGRRPGTGYEKDDAPLVKQIVTMVRSGETASASAAAGIVVGDGKAVSGGGTITSKVDRLRRQATAALDGD